LDFTGKVEPHDSLKEAIKGYFELRGQSEKQQQEWQDYMAHREERATKKLLLRQRQVHVLRLALDKNRRKVHDLKASPSLLSDKEAVCKDRLEGSPATANSDEQQPPASFRSGPAPRSESLASTAVAAARNERLQRRSTWSGIVPEHAGLRNSHRMRKLARCLHGALRGLRAVADNSCCR
jgi:hypothetical protein